MSETTGLLYTMKRQSIQINSVKN